MTHHEFRVIHSPPAAMGLGKAAVVEAWLAGHDHRVGNCRDFREQELKVCRVANLQRLHRGRAHPVAETSYLKIEREIGSDGELVAAELITLGASEHRP